jgi:hypothetical protein
MGAEVRLRRRWEKGRRWWLRVADEDEGEKGQLQKIGGGTRNPGFCTYILVEGEQAYPTKR